MPDQAPASTPAPSKERVVIEHPPDPYLVIALLCSRFIKGEDGSLSAIGFLDQIDIVLSHQVDGPLIAQQTNVWAVIGFRSGAFSGTKTLTLRGVSPGGGVGMEYSNTIEFKGGMHAHYYHIELVLNISAEGLYWFEVFLDNKLYSRMPLLVIRKVDAQTTNPPRSTQP